MSENLRSQNLSIMMTDIQGYTDSSSASSREEIIGLIRRHNQLMVPIITFYGGKIIKSIGDAFLCTFQSATDAVVCAIIIQLLLKEYNDKRVEKTHKMNLRVVINTGDVSLEKNDIYGDAVNVTARMEGLPCFPGGTIGISESTHLLMNKNEIVDEKVGPQTLKGIPEPVVVYKVPLEMQKLTKIPIKLSQIVERSVNPSSASAGGGSNMTANQLNEWNAAVFSFLKEKNWGENIGAMLDEKKIRENVSNIQKQVTTSFSQKTVIESKATNEFNEAAMASRIKAFFIDAVIILIISLVIKFVIWWPVQNMVWGNEYLTDKQYIEKIANIGQKGDYDKEKAFKNMYDMRFSGGEMRYYRAKSFPEWVVSFNVEFPFLLMILYFGIFWAAKGASPGQIASKNAVVTDDGQMLNIVAAFKRSVLFVVSVSFFFIGVLMIFGGDKKTLYDKICETKVVE